MFFPDRTRGGPPADNSSQVGSLLQSTNNRSNDAVTTRERLRQRRRDEGRALYERSLPARCAGDPSHRVISNQLHQQMDTAPATPQTHALVDNLVHGAYYGERTQRIPDIEKPHGLGRRYERGSSCPASAANRRPDAAVSRESVLRAKAAEQAARDAVMQGPAKPGGYAARPYPQDDGHDDWGRRVPRPPRRYYGKWAEETKVEEPKVRSRPLDGPVVPVPELDPTSEAYRQHERPCDAPNEWQKPAVTDPKRAPLIAGRPPEKSLATRATLTDDGGLARVARNPYATGRRVDPMTGLGPSIVTPNGPTILRDDPPMASPSTAVVQGGVARKFSPPANRAQSAERRNGPAAQGYLPKRRGEAEAHGDVGAHQRFRSRPRDTLMQLL